MSMTDEIKKVVAESVEAESVTEEEISEVAEEVVEEEVEVAEAKVKEEEEDEKDDSDEDEDEVEESADSEEEEEEDEVEEVSIPKTKAGVINAALDMLKKARKDEAQQLFAKMVKQVSETSVKKEEVNTESSNKVEDANWDEDLDILVAEEVTLSDGFRDKAGAIFEAAYKMKVSAEIDRLESEYAQNLEEEVSEVHSSLVEKVDSYLNYVVEGWMKENELQVQQGLRTEIAEEFMTSLQSVFKEHYIDVPEGKEDLVDDLNEQVTELEETLNKTTDENIKLHEAVQLHEKAEVVREQSSGLAETEAEKLASLVEDIEFDNRESFEIKVKTVKESYFNSGSDESVDEVDNLLGAGEVESDTSDSMSQYTQAITNFTN
jgi:hypothetical protein